MSGNKADSIMYMKYRTLCCVPEEIYEKHSAFLKLRLTDELYKKVKQKIVTLSESDMEQKIDEMNNFLRNFLEDRKSGSVTIKTENNVKKSKKDYSTRILELMNNNASRYSRHLRQDKDMLQNVKSYFVLENTTKVYYVFDWTVAGFGKEGLVISSEGIHFRFIGSEISIGTIKWEELNQYDFQLQGSSIRLKKKDTQACECFYFFEHQDAVNFMDVLEEMQKL